jgi:hypothetical protein
MDAATEKKPAAPVQVLLAGLQAGMLGAGWMLTWLGLSSVWQRRSFWTPENLMASVFYGKAAIHEGFASSTVSGAALYLLIYSALGVAFALIFRDRIPRSRLLLASLIFSLAWYYLSFRVIWRTVSPLIALLHVEQTTLLGHLIYGIVLSRYPVYLPRQMAERSPDPAGPAVIDVEQAPRAQ